MDQIKLPIETISADQLPQGSPLKYDEICRLVGSLYLESAQQFHLLSEQIVAVKLQANQTIENLSRENELLKNEIKKLTSSSEGIPVLGSGNSGQRKKPN